jgi:hypothetical protein
MGETLIPKQMQQLREFLVDAIMESRRARRAASDDDDDDELSCGCVPVEGVGELISA